MMANFHVDYEGKRYGFRYKFRGHYLATLECNAVEVEDIPPEPVAVEEPILEPDIEPEGPGLEPEPPEDALEPDPPETLPSLNNGEATMHALKLMDDLGISIDSVPADGGVVKKGDVVAYHDSLQP